MNRNNDNPKFTSGQKAKIIAYMFFPPLRWIFKDYFAEKTPAQRRRENRKACVGFVVLLVLSLLSTLCSM